VSERPLILIIDDDRDVAEAIADALEDEGYATEIAGDGAEALAQIASGARPGAVILDLMMPVMDGWEFRARLAKQGMGELPIIVCTADGHASEKAAELKAVGHLRKPPSLTDLIGVVRAAIGLPPRT
jgi:CheY-like chemotaxis protein